MPPQGEKPAAASGSLRTYADDEQTWEVGQPRSTSEVAEQSRATGGGGMEGRGLAKGNSPQRNAFRTQSRDRRAQRAGAGTSSSK